MDKSEGRGNKGASLGLKLRRMMRRSAPSSSSLATPSLSAVHFESWDEALVKLDLRSRLLDYVPPGVLSLTALTWLGLNGNRIVELPAGLSALSLLKVLRIHSNCVVSLPAHLGELHALTVLDLGKNKIKSVDNSLFAGLTSLKDLSLEWNQLTELGSEVEQCTALRKLNIAINRLVQLPGPLSGLSLLEELDVSHNRKQLFNL